jgi:DNA-binding GntR family transcriptional regulator
MKSKDAPTPSGVPLAGQLGREHASLGQRVADELRRSILTNRRRPGDRLVEDRLSEELGVSRVPIREALRALAAEGLVDVLPRRGASVADVSPEVARDLVEVRATLEGLNARLAARHHDPEIIAELRQVLAAGNKAARSKNIDDLVHLNGQFHDKLAEAGRNTILWDIMRTLRERTGLVFATNTARRARQDWDEHSKILAAVIGGNEKLASELATHHVHRAAEAAFAATPASRTMPPPVTTPGAPRHGARARASAARAR